MTDSDGGSPSRRVTPDFKAGGANLLVLKFGGTSVGTPRRVRLAARRVAAHVRRGRRVVVVVSAAGHSTDLILRWAESVSGGAVAGGRAARELDRALATGEDRSAALLAVALEARGIPARSLRGGEAGLEADGRFGHARLRALDARNLLALLDVGIVPVVSGFQAERVDGETVTLGRGASDTTAVALATSLGAECHIVTDVPAVYDRDPRKHQGARPLPALDHASLATLAAGGAKVVQLEAARLAQAGGVPLRVYAFDAPLSGRGGTVVRSAEEDSYRQPAEAV